MGYGDDAKEEMILPVYCESRISSFVRQIKILSFRILFRRTRYAALYVGTHTPETADRRPNWFFGKTRPKIPRAHWPRRPEIT